MKITLDITANSETRESWATKSRQISGMMSGTTFNLDVTRGVNCELSPTRKKDRRSNKEKEYNEASKIAMGVLSVFPRIMENNQVESRDVVAMYYKQYVKPLLKHLTIDVGVSTSSGGDDASYGPLAKVEKD